MSDYLYNSDFLLRVSAGLIPGNRHIHKFGYRELIPLDTVVDVWNFPDEIKYTFSTSAAIDTISSSDDTDVVQIRIYGLDADWKDKIQVVTLTGQTKKLIDIPLIRVYRMETVGVVSLLGKAFLYEDTPITLGKPDDTTKVRAYIDDGDNQTLMTVYTVPDGVTAFNLKTSVTLAGKANGSVIINQVSRKFGEVFHVDHRFALGGAGGFKDLDFPIPELHPARTDLLLCADSDTQNVALSGMWDLLLVENSVIAAGAMG